MAKNISEEVKRLNDEINDKIEELRQLAIGNEDEVYLRVEVFDAQARVIKPGSREEAWADRNYRGDLVAGDWLPSSWVC